MVCINEKLEPEAGHTFKPLHLSMVCTCPLAKGTRCLPLGITSHGLPLETQRGDPKAKPEQLAVTQLHGQALCSALVPQCLGLGPAATSDAASCCLGGKRWR